jgi:hypothetical protein
VSLKKPSVISISAPEGSRNELAPNLSQMGPLRQQRRHQGQGINLSSERNRRHNSDGGMLLVVARPGKAERKKGKKTLMMGGGG